MTISNISNKKFKSIQLFKVLLNSNFLISVIFPTSLHLQLFKEFTKKFKIFKQQNFFRYNFISDVFSREQNSSGFIINGGTYIISCDTIDDFFIIIKYFLKERFYKTNIRTSSFIDLNDIINPMAGFLISVKIFKNFFPCNFHFFNFLQTLNTNLTISKVYYHLNFFKITCVVSNSIMLILIKISMIVLKLFFFLLNNIFFIFTIYANKKSTNT